MVYRKRKFIEVHGTILLEATVFGRALREAESNAPLGSEIFDALEQLWKSVRHLQITLTGDPEYGIARPQHALEPAAEGTEARTWDTIPLWKEQAAKQ